MNSTDVNEHEHVYEYALILHKYVPPFLIGIGTFGRALTIIAVNGPTSKRTSFTVYLTMLAIVDFLVLYTWTLNTWLKYTFDVVVEESASILCKLYHYATFVLTELSSWLVMCLTIERTVCVYSNQTGKMPSARSGLIVTVSIAMVLCAASSHIIYGWDLVDSSNRTICGFVDRKYLMFYHIYWSKVHFCLYFILPACVLIIGNSATVIKVIRSRRSLSSGTRHLMQRHTRQVFLITLFISLSFLILVTPLPLMFFFAPINVTGLVETIFSITLYMNHTINFFLYVLSGSRFREDLKNSLGRLCCAIDEPRDFSMISTSRNSGPVSMISTSGYAGPV